MAPLLWLEDNRQRGILFSQIQRAEFSGGYTVFFFKEAVKRGIVGEAAGFPYILEGHALQDFIFCINKAALDYAMVKGDVQLLAEQGDGKRKKI